MSFLLVTFENHIRVIKLIQTTLDTLHLESHFKPKLFKN